MSPGLHENEFTMSAPVKENGNLKKRKDDAMIEIKRPVYLTKDFRDEYYRPEDNDKTLLESVKEKVSSCVDCSPRKRKQCCLNFFPFIKIMKSYKVREDLPNDIIAGLTVGIMQLPQGMAYAMLAEMPPVVGLYMSFFPVLMYFFFGTSKQISMGTVAVVSLMTGTVVGGLWDKYGQSVLATTTAAPGVDVDSVSGYVVGLNNTSYNFTDFYNSTEMDNSTFLGATLKSSTSMHPAEFKFKILIATSIAFIAGVTQILMSFGRLGVVTTYMSEPLINGFTTGAAVHVFTSQVKYIFGLKIPRFGNLFQIVRTYFAIITNIEKTNVATLIVSIICIIILYIVKVQINTRYKEKLRIPIPIELIVVVIGTIASKFGNFNDMWSIKIVGEVPAGLPVPAFPSFSFVSTYLVDAIVIAVIAFAQSISLAAIMAKRNHYAIDSNKELFAYGVGNVFGSFFSCYPFAASVSRSSVQDSAHGKTQLASIFSAVLVLIVIIAIGPLFESLPICILSSIIVVALRRMLLQVFDLKGFARTSAYDGAIWFVTFVCVVILHADLGLLVGMVFSFFTVVLRSQKAAIRSTAEISGVGTFEEKKAYREASMLPSVRIVYVDAPVYFANGEIFVNKVYELTGIKPERFRKILKKLGTSLTVELEVEKEHKNGGFSLEVTDEFSTDVRELLKIRHVIIDMTAVTFTDTVGVKCLRTIIEEYREVHITVYLAGIREDVWRVFEVSDFATKYENNMFITVNDAVVAALKPRVKDEEEAEVIEEDSVTPSSRLIESNA